MRQFQRLFIIMTKPQVAILYLGLVIGLVLYLDKPLSTYIFDADLRKHFPILSYITKAGVGVLYFPVFFGLAIFFRYIRKNPLWEARSWFLFLCITVPTAICVLLKIVLGRARPNLYLQSSEHFYGFYGFKTDANFWSFPSGHTTIIMGVSLGFSILFPRYFLAFILFGLSVAFSRVLLTHHYLSDVLFTIFLTLIEVACLLSLLKRKSWLRPLWPRW